MTRLSRRRFVRFAALSGTVGLAGCGSQSSDSAGSGSPEPTGDGQKPGSDGPQSSPQNPRLVEKLVAPDGEEREFFGYSADISADGTTVLVGARDDTTDDGETGSVYAFDRGGDGWQQAGKFVPDGASGGENVGDALAVAADGTTAVVGAPDAYGPNGTDGAVYVIERDGDDWQQAAELGLPTDSDVESFGDGVDISADGSTVVVGSSSISAPADPTAGSVSVFSSVGGNWQLTAMPGDDDVEYDDGFGGYVAISGDGSTLAVGDTLTSTAVNDSTGIAYVFTRSGDTWSQAASLVPEDVSEDARFGSSLSLSEDGETLAVGAVQDETDDGFDAGSAYVFSTDGTTWQREAKLLPDERTASDRFGTVDISGDGQLAVIGAIGANTGEYEAGAGYVFERDNDWQQAAEIVPDQLAEHDGFGGDVAISGDGTRALFAAGGDNEIGPNAGATYTFDL